MKLVWSFIVTALVFLSCNNISYAQINLKHKNILVDVTQQIVNIKPELRRGFRSVPSRSLSPTRKNINKQENTNRKEKNSSKKTSEHKPSIMRSLLTAIVGAAIAAWLFNHLGISFFGLLLLIMAGFFAYKWFKNNKLSNKSEEKLSLRT